MGRWSTGLARRGGWRAALAWLAAGALGFAVGCGERGERAEPAPDAASAPAPSDAPAAPGAALAAPSLALELPERWQPAGRTDEGALFRLADVPDVQLHVALRSEPAPADLADAKAASAALRAVLEESGVDDLEAGITSRGCALVRYGVAVTVSGVPEYTRHFVLVRPAPPDRWLRADLVVAFPPEWREAPGVKSTLSSLAERLDQADLTPPAP